MSFSSFDYQSSLKCANTEFTSLDKKLSNTPTNAILRQERRDDFILFPNKETVNFLEPERPEPSILNQCTVSFFDQSESLRKRSVDAGSRPRPGDRDSSKVTPLGNFGFEGMFSFSEDTFGVNQKIMAQVPKSTFVLEDSNMFSCNKNRFHINELGKIKSEDWKSSESLFPSLTGRKQGRARGVKPFLLGDECKLKTEGLALIQTEDRKKRKVSLKLEPEEVELFENHETQGKKQPKDKRYSCEFCSQTFSNPQAKGGHISKAHNNLTPKYKKKIKSKCNREKKKLELQMQLKMQEKAQKAESNCN